MRKLLAVLLTGSLVLALVPGLAGAAAPWHLEYTRQVQSTGEISSMLLHPQGVTTDKFGNVYVVSQDLDVIDVYDIAGTRIHTWAMTAGGFGELNDVYDVAVDRWGNIYAVEHAGRQVSVYNAAGLFTRHISTGGSDPGELSNPNAVAVDLDGYVYVTDNTTEIDKFKSDGTYVDTWATDGPALGIECDQDGFVWVANDEASTTRPDYGNTVMKYSPWGDMLASWGGTGTADGEFKRAYDVSIDGAGRVFALDSEGERVQVFEGDGLFLTSYNGADASLFSIPYGVAAGFMREGWVADTFRNRALQFTSVPSVPTQYRPVQGANRYATAAEAATVGWDESEYAVVATGKNWPDALSGAGLAGVCDAPLLLTDPNTLSPEAAAKIVDLNCDQVFLLGGTGAVSDAVVGQIEAIMHGPGSVERIGGVDRFDTSAQIAAKAIELKGAAYDGTGFVVTGRNFPDALAASPIAAANGWPILLTDTNDLPDVIADAMTAGGINHGYVIGGEGAVGPDAFAEIDALWLGTPMRIAGATRYETAAAVADIGFEGMGMLWSRPALATGQNFPDALAGGVLQGSDCSVMLLTKSTSLDPAAAAALTENKDSIYELRYLGGTSALSTAVRTSVEGLLH